VKRKGSLQFSDFHGWKCMAAWLPSFL